MVTKTARLNSTQYFIIKIQKKKRRELQQIGFNHSSDSDFQDFMNFYKKCTAKLYSSTLASDSFSIFRKNLLERISKLIMTIDDKVKKKQPRYRHYHQIN